MAEEHHSDLSGYKELEEMEADSSESAADKTERTDQAGRTDEFKRQTSSDKTSESTSTSKKPTCESTVDTKSSFTESSESIPLSSKTKTPSPLKNVGKMLRKIGGRLFRRKSGESTTSDCSDIPPGTSAEEIVESPLDSQEVGHGSTSKEGKDEVETGESSSGVETPRFLDKVKTAAMDLKNDFKSMVSTSKSKGETLPIVAEEMDIDEHAPRIVSSVISPKVKRYDLETFAVEPQLYDETKTDSTSLDEAEMGKRSVESSDTEAQRSMLTSLGQSSDMDLSSAGKESSKPESSDVVADVSSEEKEQESHKTSKRTPLKRHRKAKEDDSSDSEAGAAGLSPRKRVPLQRRTTRL